MRIVGRIISIRKHKTILFFKLLPTNHSLIECAINKKDICENNISVGDIIDAEFVEGKNHSGEKIFFIRSFIKIYHNNNPVPVKSPKQKIKSVVVSNRLASLFGEHYNFDLWRYKIDLIREIRQYLDQLQIKEVNTDILNKYRGTYKANPFSTYSVQHKKYEFLRITMELELKKIATITMLPVYEIGNVYRNGGKSYDHINEYTVLEMVLPGCSNVHLFEIINHISNIAFNLLQKKYPLLSLASEKWKAINAIDYVEYKDVCSSDNFDETKKKIRNSIVYNMMHGSPLAKKNEDYYKEFEWIFCGYSVAHGYEDENDYDILLNRFLQQKEQLKNDGILSEEDKSFLTIMQYPCLDSSSLCVGIDRLIMLMLEAQNVLMVHNPLGL